MASTKLTNTMGTPTLGTKFTFSCWIKRGALGAESTMIQMYQDGNNLIHLRFDLQDNLSFYVYNSASFPLELETNAVFRDTSAWSHIVAKVDTTQSTASDRCKLYVNGSEQISLSASTYPSQNATFNSNASGSVNNIGGRGNSGGYFDGSMTHFHFTDGYAYDASTFGETDTTSGIWKPKTSPSVTYGSNGFFLKFENSGAMGTDSSGNSNTFTVGNGTLTQNVDTPSNNFATGNPLVMNPSHTATFSNGNNKIVSTAAGKQLLVSTLAANSGKFYAEYKADAVGGGTMIGVIPYDVVVNTLRQNNYFGQDDGSVCMYSLNGAVYNPPTASGITGVSYTDGDIIGVAVDLDNSYCYFHKNGTYINSGDPTSGATGTGGVPFTKGDSFWCFAGGDSTNAGGSVATTSANFGSGFFGTTAVASAGTAPSEGGIFEYDCPSGYQALCTKGINSF